MNITVWFSFSTNALYDQTVGKYICFKELFERFRIEINIIPAILLYFTLKDFLKIFYNKKEIKKITQFSN